jgi:uracil-DNA glycosylase family 4
VPPATEPADDLSRRLDALRSEVEQSPCCQLFGTRSRLVFGEGDPAADLMFVGEAPGYHEDQQGRPFVGAAGKLLEELLAGIGLRREEVYIANVLKCRPPNNRDPLPAEVAACEPYLWKQIEIISPRVVCSLGNHATKLLSGKPLGITKVHGRPQAVRIGQRTVHLYPIFHPAAALYTPAMLTTLREDFRRLPEVLALPLPEATEESVRDSLATGVGGVVSDGGVAPQTPAAEPEQPASPAGPAEQLGLF